MKMSLALCLSLVFIDDFVFGWQENLSKIEKVTTSFFLIVFLFFYLVKINKLNFKIYMLMCQCYSEFLLLFYWSVSFSDSLVTE